MSVSEFWIGVRVGARMVAPPRVVVDSPHLDAQIIEDMLRNTDPWLNPEVVAGFDEKDFSFLPDDERGRLARLVADFRAVAETVSPTGPAPSDAVERALPLFRDIVQALAFDRYGDAEAFRLGKLIEREIAPRKPPELAELRFNTGLDHSGDPGLWIWAFLSDEASSTDERFLETSQTLRTLLDWAARRVAPDRWPYISFRSLADQLEPVEAS